MKSLPQPDLAGAVFRAVAIDFDAVGAALTCRYTLGGAVVVVHSRAVQGACKCCFRIECFGWRCHRSMSLPPTFHRWTSLRTRRRRSWTPQHQLGRRRCRLARRRWHRSSHRCCCLPALPLSARCSHLTRCCSRLKPAGAHNTRLQSSTLVYQLFRRYARFGQVSRFRGTLCLGRVFL